MVKFGLAIILTVLTPGCSVERESSRGDTSTDPLSIRSVIDKGSTQLVPVGEEIQANLRDFIENYPYIGARTEKYRAPSEVELKVFAELVDRFLAQDFIPAQAKASALGLLLATFRDTGDANTGAYCILPAMQRESGRGLYCFNPLGQRKLHVSVPHPLFDAKTNVVGIDILRGTKARYFSVATAHRCANTAVSACSGTTSVCGEPGPYRESDASHNQATFFQVFSEKVHEHHGANITAQLHGCGKGSCPTGTASDVVARLSIGSNDSFDDAVLSNRLSQQLNSVVGNLKSGARARSCNLRNEPDQLLCATTNTQGRYINGIKNSPCMVSTEAPAHSRFLHIEASADLRRDDGPGDAINPSLLIDALNATLPW